MAWSGWWHNQIGLLTEVASVRDGVAPIQQLRATPGTAGLLAGMPEAGAASAFNPFDNAPLAAANRRHAAHRISAALAGRPLDAPRHRRLRAHLDDGAARDGGGSPRDDPAADLRSQPADRRGTAERRRRAILVPMDGQHDPREAAHLADRLQVGGVEVFRSDAAFEADGRALRRRHARHPDDAGVRALREGSAREADVSGRTARAERPHRAAVRRHGVVARHAARRGRGLRENAASLEPEADARQRPAADRVAARRQRRPVRLRLRRSRHGHRRQPAARRAAHAWSSNGRRRSR